MFSEDLGSAVTWLRLLLHLSSDHSWPGAGLQEAAECPNRANDLDQGETADRPCQARLKTSEVSHMIERLVHAYISCVQEPKCSTWVGKMAQSVNACFIIVKSWRIHVRSWHCGTRLESLCWESKDRQTPGGLLTG